LKVAAIGFPFTTAAFGFVAATGALPDVGDVAVMPPADRLAGDTAGADTLDDGADTMGTDAVSKPGFAVTDTRDPPSAITNTFSLGFPGGFHSTYNDPAV
jgi:hypothetical protein